MKPYEAKQIIETVVDLAFEKDRFSLKGSPSFVVLFLILISLNLNAQEMTKNAIYDSSFKQLASSDAKQNLLIQKLDSTITQLKNENAYLKQLAEKDIDHAKSLINMTEVIVGFIAVLLAIFTVVGGFIITKMFRQSNQISKDHKVLLDDWEIARKEINDMRTTSEKENRDFLQILFFVTEGDSKFEEENPEDAIYYYNQALKIKDNNSEVSVKLADAYVEIGEYDKAIVCLQNVYEKDPENVSIMNSVARAYRKSREYEQAEKFYKMAYEKKPDHIWVLSGLGQIYIQKHDFENAEKIYKKLMEIDNSFFPIFNLAFVKLGKTEQKKAEDFFKIAINLIDQKLYQSSDKKMLNRYKALALFGLSNFEEAEKLLIEQKTDGLYPSEVRSITDRLIFLYDLNPSKRMKEIIDDLENSSKE